MLWFVNCSLIAPTMYLFELKKQIEIKSISKMVDFFFVTNDLTNIHKKTIEIIGVILLFYVK